MFERPKELEVPMRIELDILVEFEAANTPPIKEPLILQERLPHSNPTNSDCVELHNPAADDAPIAVFELELHKITLVAMFPDAFPR
jgi:hypothetical protein